MKPVLLKSENNVLKQFFALLRGPSIVTLKDRDAVLLFVGLNIVVQHSSAFDSHDPVTPIFISYVTHILPFYEIKSNIIIFYSKQRDNKWAPACADAHILRLIVQNLLNKRNLIRS